MGASCTWTRRACKVEGAADEENWSVIEPIFPFASTLRLVGSIVGCCVCWPLLFSVKVFAFPSLTKPGCLSWLLLLFSNKWTKSPVSFTFCRASRPLYIYPTFSLVRASSISMSRIGQIGFGTDRSRSPSLPGFRTHRSILSRSNIGL